MWETFISWYINNYLGKYVENLNSQQLSFALRQGELELENVPLKKNIFRSWGLPIEVRSGVVGRIQIEFNLLKYFRNEPVLISIQDIYLVAGPLNLAEWDPVEEAALAHETKMSSLDSHEGRWKAQFDLASNSSSYYSSLYFSSMEIGASIVTKVVENLQINVSNVHIRFEEDTGSTSHVVAFGVTLKGLTAKSCDANWNPLSTSTTGNNTNSSFKTLQLSEFAVYCDTKSQRFSDLTPLELISRMSKISKAHDYILFPVSAEARISKNNSSHPLSSASNPRFDVHLSLERVPMQLSDSQYRNTYRSCKAFSRLYRNCRLRRHRPFIGSVAENPVLWWKYAIRAILDYRGFKKRTVLKTTEEVLQRARDNVSFVMAYEQHLKQQLISTDLRKLKDRMEVELHYDEIVALREIAMRRVEQSHATKPAAETGCKDHNTPSSSSGSSTGAFSYIFPSWSNWLYSADTTTTEPTTSEINPTGTDDFENEIIQLRKSESELDESILDDVKSFGRDVLLARFNFVLKKGVVALSRRNGRFLELDFCDVNILAELRPKNTNHKFHMTLSTLSLRDCSTKSLLVSPHTVSIPFNMKTQQQSSLNPCEPIFKLNYERKPHKKAGHRVNLTTKSLDLVIYPLLWKEVTSFFTFTEIEDYLEVSHLNHYEIMKEKTKEELKMYWERLINSRKNPLNSGHHSNWEINLDISAPQIIIHGSNFPKLPTEPQPQLKLKFHPRSQATVRQKENPKFLVFDLGRFRFTNMVDIEDRDQLEQVKRDFLNEEDEDEDEFLTPCTSPAPERVTSEGGSNSTGSRPSISDGGKLMQLDAETGFDLGPDSLGMLQAKLYKKYKLEITDIQIIIVEGKACQDGTWKNANARSTSLLHLVDRFSINLQLERRLVYSEDPEWPALTVMATLPKLNLHMNKSKILNLRSVLGSYLVVSDESELSTTRFNLSNLSGSQVNLQEMSMDAAENSHHHPEKPQPKIENPSSSNSKVFLAQFTIQSVSVEIQSQGRSIAELQITGATTTLTKWTKHTSISFVIHSLLLADAIQTFGPDFELLLASHKHVSMDTVSGSLLDSDPTSPQSPSSPMPFSQPRVQGRQMNLTANLSELHDALLNSLHAKAGPKHTQGIQSPTNDIEALITAELMIVHSESEDIAILSVLFNNLDVIANQETFLEIIQFLQEISPAETSTGKVRTESGSASTLLPGATDKWKIEASFDFSRLNILLLRGIVGKDGNRGGRKIATATACDARVGISFGDKMLKIEGSLGGLQMLNLTPEGKYHQRVLSVGKDPLIDATYNVFTPNVNIPNSSRGGSNTSALDFTYEKSTEPNSATLPVFTMRMASVIYTHCPIFLIDLKKCIDQFQIPLATKLKSAAAHIALGLVRQDTVHGLSGTRSPFGSFSVSLDGLNTEDGDEAVLMGLTTNSLGVKLDIVFDSPVIALPRNRTSSQVLVANLGQITISANGAYPWDDGLYSTASAYESNTESFRNTSLGGGNSAGPDLVNYNLLIRDVSLYSLDLKERWDLINNLRTTYPTLNRNTLMRAQELYYCDPSNAKPILHNTVLQFDIDYIPESPFINAELNATSLEAEEEFIGPKVGIHGRVVNPLKVSLTPEQYAQALDSLNNVAAGDEDFLELEFRVESMETRKAIWEKEIADIKIPVPRPSPTRFEDDSICISATFDVPELIVELVLPEEEFGKEEIPHLSLSCSELSFECEKREYVTEMKVCLKSLTLEDTSASKDSQYRLLAMSQSLNSHDISDSSTVTMMSSVFHRNPNISTSCPDLVPTTPIHVTNSATLSSPIPFFRSPTSCARTESSSLPDNLNPDDIFNARFYQIGAGQQKRSGGRPKSRRRDSIREYRSPSFPSNGPKTPPPSPRPFDMVNNLVTVRVIMVDQKSRHFLKKYKGTHKATDVEFNTLAIVLTPNTFACLRRFFNDAFRNADFEEENLRSRNKAKTQIQSQHSPEEFTSVSSNENERNTETEIHVKELRVKFANGYRTTAEAEVMDVMCRLVNQGKNFSGVDGRLGSLQVKDVSPHAGKYPFKFIFQGKEALNFDYCRKDNEGRFRLEMASVLYIHTHRFYSEFYNLITSLFGGSEGGSTEMEPNTATFSSESPHVILNIQAGAPIIFFPYSSTSPAVLVADFGHLSVRNKLMEDKDLRRCLDYISVDLLEMDLYSAELRAEIRVSTQKKIDEYMTWVFNESQTIVKTLTSSSLLKDKCALNLKVKRLLSRKDMTQNQASLSIHGTLSAVYATLNLDKYKLIRGLLQYNIGEAIEYSRPPSPIHLRRHSSDTTTGASRKITASSTRLDLAIELDLVNVTVEILKQNAQKLSRVDFLKSKFTFLNYSDGTRDIDLASQEILISDTRFSGSCDVEGASNNPLNVFTNILQQSTNVDSTPIRKTSQGSSQQKSEDGNNSKSSSRKSAKLRAEVHFRETQRSSNVTILLNNMRLMLILDWWIEIKSFLSEEILEPSPLVILEHLEVIESDEAAAEKRLRNVSPVLNRSKGLMNPVTVSTGIVTKRAPVLDVPGKTFDFKLNVNDCELVVIEDSSIWDTNAIIFKITATLTYRPHLERPISCNIMESELFSCVLGIESETALSILDPTSLTIEVIRKTKEEPQGILDATLSPSFVDKILKIKSTQVSLRLSYYDMKMFIQLIEKFSKDAHTQFQLSTRRSPLDSVNALSRGRMQERYFHSSKDSLDQLVAMGFSRANSSEALEKCGGRVEEAAIFLSSSPVELLNDPSDFAETVEDKRKTPETVSENRLGVMCGIEVKITGLSLCVIDDCRDADVPLVEFKMNGLELVQDCIERHTTAEASLSGDYYNREMCGWEPLIEPWKFCLSLQQNECGQLGKYSPSSEFPTKAPELEVSLTSYQTMNMNLTSTFLTLYKNVSSNWSDEYGHHDKRRSPFVPFELKNDTGSTIWFSTKISNYDEVLRQQREGIANQDATAWIQVGNGASQNFSFEGRGKLRHRNTHQLKTHQLAVRVNGWYESSPVSVDRVGMYFRAITPVSNNSRDGQEMPELPTTRLVFEVILQGSAQKLVRIRSALMVKNTLSQTMELKLENTIVYPAFKMAQTGGSFCLYVRPQQTYPIPLHSVCAQIWIRPILSTEFQQTVYSYCSKPLMLGSNAEGLRTCTSFASNQEIQPYRFCVAIKRDEFPADTDEPEPRARPLLHNVSLGLAKRANLITILSPLTIVNLLPYEIVYELKEQSGSSQVGQILPGKKSCITNVDTTENVEINFSTENFPQGTSVTVSTNSQPFVAKLKLFDTQKRTLYINARVSRGDSGTINVRVSCQYWIINKTGVPLIIKQEGASGESAGQFQEHEHARMIVPLLFSFSDTEGASTNVTMRVGAGLHPPPAKPHWCRAFPFQNGTRARKLIVGLSHSQPEVVYLIGMEVSDGRGKYRDSKFVTITPRFVIENQSSRKMQISQINFATSFLDPAAEATHLTLPPGCTLPFHWPRLDKDQLLCLRLLDVKGGAWSGGFPIENILSFHLNARDFEGGCHFVRVETVLEGPTYFVVFSDTDQLPPPFRIDNLSLVSIIFHQTKVGDERLKLVAKAESSFPYALDEPTQSPHLTLSAPGGTSAIANLDASELGLIAHMTYENFFYIALVATFPPGDGGNLAVSGMETLQLVLDVPEGSKVVLRKKQTGNRNQLWRVNGDGLIEHEGSCPPRDPRKPLPPPTLVLDIAGTATQPSQCVHLMLRKADARRSCTQHWEFTKDGRLKCATLENMYVQAKDGFEGLDSNSSRGNSRVGTGVAAWQMWNEVVLGPPQPVCFIRTRSGVPIEQAVAKQKLRLGSGRLSVYVDTDGPTRVLRIVDTEKPPRSLLLNHTLEENPINVIPKMVLNLDLLGGLGISVISCTPREELVYMLLSKLSMHWLDTKESDTVSISVDYFQIDNQLLESEKSVAVYVTPTGRPEHEDKIPALLLRWKRLKSNLNAHLFKEWELSIKPLNIIFEEKLLLKLCIWFGLRNSEPESSENVDDGIDVQKALTNSTSLTTKRFYFGHLKIILQTVRLSVLTSSKLSPELALMKRQLGLTLIRFEETLVELDPFYKQHPFETFDFLLASILKHYKEELLSQAFLVLGSVDFLGNPVGFVNDVSVGVSSLINEGSLDTFLWNVTHGLTNSAAKMTGSLGDGLTRTLTMDAKHEEMRRRIRGEGSSDEPLTAGVKGLTIGLYGGVTSIFRQTYEGIVNDGFTGLVLGLGKGIVGTVTKPAVGILDLAAGAASAIRDSSRTSVRITPKRFRPTRVVAGNGGLLPPYSEIAAKGQELMYDVNGKDYDALFIGCETIRSYSQTLKILVSSEKVTVFTVTQPRSIQLDISLRDLVECRLVEIKERPMPQPTPTAMYGLERKLAIEFTRNTANPSFAIIRPELIVNIDFEQTAKTVVQQVNYARILYEERRHSQINKDVTPIEE